MDTAVDSVASSPDPRQLFVSYAFEDHAYATRLVQSLSDFEEVRLWLDKDTLVGGAEWRADVLQAIENSRFFIVIVSRTWIEKSGFAKEELKRALAVGRRVTENEHLAIIPVRVDDSPIDQGDLAHLHFIDLSHDWDRGVLALRRAIRSRLEVDVTKMFTELSKVQHLKPPLRQRWMEEHGRSVAAVAPKIVIDVLSRLHSTVSDEIFALDVTLALAETHRSPAVAEYAFRLVDLVQLCYHDHELPVFYGSLLRAASRLSAHTKSALLVAALRQLNRQVERFFNGAWWADVVLRDVAKQYLCIRKSTQVTGITMSREPVWGTDDDRREVLLACLAAMRWDIPILDLLVFFGRLMQDASTACIALEVLQLGWSKRTGSGRPVPQLLDLVEACQRDGRFSSVDLNAWWEKRRTAEPRKLLWADHREDSHRAAILLRIGNTLSRVDHELGAIVFQRGVDALTSVHSRLGEAIASIDDGARPALFDAIERQDDEAVGRFFGTKDLVEAPMAVLLLEGAVDPAQKFRAVPLPLDAFDVETQPA